MEDSPESQKCQQHLTLLREQYIALQMAHTELKQKYSVATANSRVDSFIGRLLSSIASLYNEHRYSDISIKLINKNIPAHKFVLSARSDYFNDQLLDQTTVLDWSKLESTVGELILKWIYTGKVTQENYSLKLMKAASFFQLDELVEQCENYLIGVVTLKDCVQLYAAAEELGTIKLRDHCSSLISSHWEDLTGEDFKEMPGSLLYKLLQTKSKYPLHAAVRLMREDVVFLYLVENNSELQIAVNALDNKGELALEVALKTRQQSLARTLVKHGSDLSAQNLRGFSLLQAAVMKGDSYSAEFIIEQLEIANSVQKLSETVKVIENVRNIDELKEYEGCTALHLLAKHSTDDMLTVASRLLQAGVNPNLQDRKKCTALHCSIRERNDGLFNLLLECKDINLESTNDEDDTPICVAMKLEPFHEIFAKKLLNKNAIPNPVYKRTGDTLLHVLAHEGMETQALFLTEYSDYNLDKLNDQGYTVLHEACRTGLKELTRALLKHGASTTILASSTGDAPIHIAVSKQHLDIVNELLNSQDRSAQINLKNRDSETPLSLAIRASLQKAKNVIIALIRAGADVNQRDDENYTLLHRTILKEDSANAIFLLENGADINARTNDGETPLQLAVHCRLGEVVEALCKRGVDTSVGCPLWDALDSDQEDVASILVKYGADTDYWGPGPDNCQQTLLHRAIDENKEEIAQFLVRSGCDLNVPRRPGLDGSGGDEAKDNSTPLHMCCQWGLEQVVQTLIEHGADINARDADGKTPVHIAIHNQHAPIISLLLCHPNIDLNKRDKKGLSPFAAALTVRNIKAAQAILEKLPKAAEQYDNKGRNFLHTAIQKNDMESILFLLSIQVDVNSRVHDITQTPPLHLAAVTGNEMLVRSLILAGARVNDTDANRNTALHAAAKVGYSTIISALLQNNINFDAVNADGDNALHVAMREGHVSVVRTLLTECTLEAEAVNLKGRNPLHELARCGRDNAATICELILDCMPQYPVNNADLDGNTPLLIAYTKGNGNLCRVLVKAGACLGSMNKDGITIFNFQVATKQLLYRLLDSLTQAPVWADKDQCSECGIRFSITMRKHHCRHCGRILCSKCSGQDVPILKFGLNKPVRVCAVCFDVLQVGAD